MSKTKYAGIDYSGGRSNFDPKTGIHYGVINQQEVCQAWYDSSEANYGDPHCPKCGNDAITIPCHTESDPDGKWVKTIQDIPEHMEEYECQGCGDYACDDCKYLFDGEEAFGDDPISHSLDDGEYQAEAQEDGDIFIFKSPYYTLCQFCSPCAPGAGYLMSPCPDGVKAYCFDGNWFEDGVTPYPVYRVADDTRQVGGPMPPDDFPEKGRAS